MNSLIENLNQLGGQLLQFAWPMLWQSSLLIAFVFALDFLLGRKIRASVRYALWLAVLVKLLLPPTLALPTGAAWWLFHAPPAVKAPAIRNYTVTYDPAPLPEITENLPAFIPPKPRLSLVAWSLAASVFVSLMLCGWLLARWWQIARIVRRAATAENFSPALNEAWRLSGAPGTRPARFKNENQRAEPVLGAPKVGLKIVEGRMSPAVCGLFRPVILLPRTLAEHLSPAQLRAVLLHEVFHLRRKDVWVNCAQALLQIVYWWHPLLWFANARIRRLREEAVDDAVMLALRDEADGYAPTLLEVAKLAFRRPLLSLGLVGIMESRSALRQRIERLVDFRAPRRAGLTLVSLLGILAFTAVAVPMGEGPSPAEKPSAPDATAAEPRPQFALMFAMTHPEGEEILKRQLLEAGVKIPPTIIHDFNNGRLFARGTKEQLVLVQQTIWRLNGYSPQEVAAATNIPGYAVKIPVDEPAATQLYSRTFKISMDLIYANLLKQTDAQSNTNNSTVVSPAFRKLFVELGLNLESPPGKAVFYNERLGKLFVRATASDLDVIERAVEGLMTATPTQTNGNDSSPVGATNVIGIVNAFSGASGRVAATSSADAEAKAGALIQDGKLLYEMGKLDEALGKFSRVLIADPHNADAKYYLGLISSQRKDKSGKPPLGRQNIIQGLNSIRLERVAFTAMPLKDVLRYLSQQNDLKNKGVNFLINPNLDHPEGSGNSGETNLDVGSLSLITIDLPLTNAPLGDVLDAVVRGASKPIYYTIKDFAIVFAPGEPPQSFSPRIFRVDTNVFPATVLRQAAQSGFVPPADADNRVGRALRYLSAAAGVNWNSPPGKKIHYDDEAAGSVYVEATTEDLHVLQKLVATLNKPAQQSRADVPPPQIQADVTNWVSAVDEKTVPGISATNAVPPIYSRAFQVDPRTFFADLKKTGVDSDEATDGAANEAVLARNFFESLGVDWESPPGKTIFYGDKRGNLFVKATTEDLDKIERALSTLNQVAPQIHIKARFIEVPKGTLDGLKNIIAVTNPIVLSNQVAGFVGILTDKNFRTVLHNLEARSDVRNLAEPEVVTTSGRQTQMRATEIVMVVTNVAFYDTFTNQDGLVVSNSIVPQTGQMETGPVLDVVPCVLSDGNTINLTLIPSLMEFLGYDKPTNSSVAYNRAGEKIDVPRVLPRFATQQTVATLNLWDGQTVIIGGMTKTNTNVIVDKVPVLGDLPAGRRRFSSTKKEVVEDEILVFVTATIVDPAGNRVHSDDDLPFAQTGIPPQPK